MEYKTSSRYSVLTKNGFQKFKGIKKSTHQKSLIFTFNDGTDIEVSTKHLFLVYGEVFREADKFKVGECIDGKEICDITEKQGETEMFDLLGVENGAHYITSGVTSHNCAFIRPSQWEEFIDAFLPSQSALSWKKNIILSTPKGTNHFYDLVKGASPDYNEKTSGLKEPGESHNGYKLFKVHWEDVPRYQANGERMKNEDFMKKTVDKHGILYWNQNFGLEFVGSSNTLISADTLKSLSSSEVEEFRDGKLKIYEYPKEDHKYMMTVDPAKDGKDAFAVQIVDITDFTFKQVACAKLQIDYLLMPEFLYEWAEFYNFPYLIIENNEGAGQSIADQLYNDYVYENLHFDKKSDSNSTNLTKSRKRYPGFRTTPKSRRQILQTLKLFIENGKLIINDKSTINEFFQFILINNKYQADDGAHDDMVMSLALTFVPFINTKNFEDMRELVSNLYNDDDDVSDKINFTDMLTIGDFQSGTDEDYDDIKTFTSIEDAINNTDGFY